MRATLIGVAAVFLVAFNSSPPSAGAENTAGGVSVVASAQAPVTKGTTSLSLDVSQNSQIGQVAIADVITYGGPRPTIAAPDGWELIREDFTPTTRQSLYWHAIQGGDPGTPEWTFSEPVDAQGAVVLLDNVASDAPVDASSGNTGGLNGTMTAKSVATTSDGDLILAFNATDFGSYRSASCGICGGLNPTLPENESVVLNQEATGLEYWILASAQSQMGQTDPQVSDAAQFYNWVAAQVAIKPGS
ncbi:MAG: hypothetical protein WBQ86_20665 [Candidatus Binatus sp.]